MAGTENLIPLPKRTKEEQREIQRKGGKASVKARREKKLMSAIYADILAGNYEVELDDGQVKKLDGPQFIAHVAEKILSRTDSASVSLMKEIREATEGSKVNLSGEDGGPVQVIVKYAD
jgi:hypothetical protein